MVTPYETARALLERAFIISNPEVRQLAQAYLELQEQQTRLTVARAAERDDPQERREELRKLLNENRELLEALTHAQDAGSKLAKIVQPLIDALETVMRMAFEDERASETLAMIRGFVDKELKAIRAKKLPDYAKASPPASPPASSSREVPRDPYDDC